MTIKQSDVAPWEAGSAGTIPRPRTADQRSRAERQASGKAARLRLPRSTAGQWAGSADRDPVGILTAQATGRLPELVPLRHARMLASPFAFYRGSAAVMAADLASIPHTGIRVQLCGDAHVANFGGYAAADRQLVFDVNDFDETLPGPWEWDLKRLTASLAVAARSRAFAPPERRRLVLSAARAYREAIRQFAGMTNLQVWYTRLTVDGVLERWGAQADPATLRNFERSVRKSQTKDSAKAVSRFTQVIDGEQRLASDPPLLMTLSDLMTGEERVTFEQVARDALRAYQRSLAGDHRSLLEQYDYVDMGRKVVGVGSVGTRCFIVLFRGIDGDDPLMLQVKEAGESVLARYAGRSKYANQGQRVVEGQRLMQASSDIFLGWSRGAALDGTARDFYVRQLWDRKLSADLEQATVAGLRTIGLMCGWTLARAHARSGDRVAIASYLGAGDSYDTAMADFAESYADQNELDYGRFADAAKAGRIKVAAAP